ncbi:MAG: efflux RND transporter periplasmic adaptor subunit [Gemmatimonadota bacterium]|nr:efflux RND transporter periplasmic adaptor subunit [Gemmatimonadota bacterium]
MNSLRTVRILLLALAAAACGEEEEAPLNIQTVPVERRDIVVDAEATGVVEPINVVEVKSKASGQIVQMPVETGSEVKPGDLLVQVDTRDVRNQYNQALADVRAAQARVEVSTTQKGRADELYKGRIITAQEYEAAQLDFANAEAQVVRARANLDLAQQRLEDATVRAPVVGTVIEKTVSLGQVITSATGAFGGGTTLLKMADLSQVRVRALVNETDIGQVLSGQVATVTVDAYPDRPFRGTVEKVEPQAVVQQSVTMFPVLVSIANREGLLKPGMNGEVSILIERREGVVSVPNDAVRNPREAVATAEVLGLDPEKVSQELQAQFAAMAGGSGGQGGPPGAGNGPVRVRTSPGEVDLAPRLIAQGGGQAQLPEVTAQQCEEVRAAFGKAPDAQGKLDALRDRMRAGEIDREQLMTNSRAIYAELGVDMRVAMACRVRVDAGPAEAGASPGTSRTRSRPGLVFVADSGTFKPRIVRLGVSNYDYSEVVSGLEEGEQVALLAAAALQAQRQESLDRFRERSGGGGVPGMQRQPPQQGGTTGGATPRAGARP